MSTLLILAAVENPFLRFGVNWYDFGSQVLAFLIIAWILNKFVFKTVMNGVAERQRVAEEAAANAARIQKELLAVEASRAEVLKTAQEQADRVISEAKTHMAEMVNQEKQRCELLGTEMLAQAREETRLDQARLKNELRGDIATLIVNLTAKLTEMNLNETDRDRMLQLAIDQISAPAGNVQS
jgi:F-type H+-transporting ATPase subunit b